MTDYDPWVHLGQMPGLTMRLTADDAELEDAYAWYYVDSHQIVVDSRLPMDLMTSVLAHEMFHAMRRHAPTGDPARDQAQEDAADHWAKSQLGPRYVSDDEDDMWLAPVLDLGRRGRTA